MIKNYFKTAWRSLSKQKAYSIINVLGLTLGIASCLVIFLVVQYELSYDKFNEKAERIVRVGFKGKMGGESGVWGKNGNKVTYDGCDWKLNGTRIEFIDELPD